ncbi:hypothetical protein DIPPA_08425 [Diplonema papillatum]|nr:hypothetical protein DIPPA_08425 [Diplonema papillatum]
MPHESLKELEEVMDKLKNSAGRRGNGYQALNDLFTMVWEGQDDAQTRHVDPTISMRRVAASQ